MWTSWSLRIPQISIGSKRFLFSVYLVTIGSFLPSFGFAAGECTPYEEYLHWLSRVDISGQGNDVTVSGSYAYVPSDTAGLHVIDIADPRHPQVVGKVDTPGAAYSVAVSGNYAYVADAAAGLQIVDVTSPEAPELVGDVDTPGEAYTVVLSGTHAYVADGSSGLQVIDITDAMDPQIVGGVDTPGLAYGVAVSGSHAYVGEFSRMLVIDITDPQNPQVSGSVESLQTAYGLAVSGAFVYIGSQDLAGGHLKVIDVSDPELPQIVGSAAGVGAPVWNVVISGGYAFVAVSSGGLAVVDISNAANPHLVSRARMPTGPDSPGIAYGVAVSGSLVFVSADVSLGVIDVANGLNPPITGQLINAGYGTPAISGSYAYLGGFGSLNVIDVVDGQNPQIVGSVAISGEVRDIAVLGDYAYVANWEGGLQVVDISNPESPEVVAGVDTPARATAVAVSGSHAYVGESLSGIQVVDISNPLAPDIVGSVDTTYPVFDLAVSGGHAYVVNSYTGLQIYDVTNPQAPELVGSMDLSYSPAICVVDGYAYVANYGSGLSVIDVTNPASPLLLGSVETIDRPEGVAVSGGYAYVADYFAGLQVVDVTDPQAPRLAGTVTGTSAADVAFSEGVIYLANGNGILSVLPGQCSQSVSVLPGSILLSSFQATPREDGILLTWDTSSDDDLVGFQVQRAESGKLDYRTLSDAMIVPPSPYRFLDVHASSGIPYQYRLESLDRYGRRELFGPISVRMDPGTAARTRLGLANPNPSRGTAQGVVIPFTMAREAPALLRILDLSGREVRTVVRMQLGPGETRAVWDGTTNEGAIAPPGIYFYRLDTPDFKSARRLVKLD